jgi:hypothetical protein
MNKRSPHYFPHNCLNRLTLNAPILYFAGHVAGAAIVSIKVKLVLEDKTEVVS